MTRKGFVQTKDRICKVEVEGKTEKIDIVCTNIKTGLRESRTTHSIPKYQQDLKNLGINPKEIEWD